MILIGAICACIGAILARHFRVLILVPTAFTVAAGVAVAEVASRHHMVHALLAGGAAACAMQLGYLLGLFVKPSGADRGRSAQITPGPPPKAPTPNERKQSGDKNGPQMSVLANQYALMRIISKHERQIILKSSIIDQLSMYQRSSSIRRSIS